MAAGRDRVAVEIEMVRRSLLDSESSSDELEVERLPSDSDDSEIAQGDLDVPEESFMTRMFRKLFCFPRPEHAPGGSLTLVFLNMTMILVGVIVGIELGQSDDDFTFEALIAASPFSFAGAVISLPRLNDRKLARFLPPIGWMQMLTAIGILLVTANQGDVGCGIPSASLTFLFGLMNIMLSAEELCYSSCTDTGNDDRQPE